MKRAWGALALLAAASVARAGDLAADVEALLAKYKLGEAAVGVCAVRVKDGTPLVERRAAETWPLASVTKLFTAAAALEILKPDYEFVTRVWVVHGVCERNPAPHDHLVVVGSGDPSISGRNWGGKPTAIFEKWAQALKAAGVSGVCRIDLDDSRFDDVRIPPGWPQDQLSEWYCAPVGALALNDDCVDVTVAPGKAGEPATVTLSPPTAFVTVENRCATTAEKKEHVVSFSRRPGTNVVVVKGRFLAGAAPWTESVTIQDPTLYFGTVLRETLDKAGVASRDAVLNRLAAPFAPAAGAKPAIEWRTGLKEALGTMLHRSQNFYAEQVLKSLAPAPSTLATSLAAEKDALKAVGVADGDLAQSDGCGLTRDNRASPGVVARFLAAESGRPAFADFEAAMAAPGEEGTLEKRLAGMEKTVRAKTGTIAGVSSLAGYVDSPNGRVAFAILISGLQAGVRPAQDFQDDLVRRLAKE